MWQFGMGGFPSFSKGKPSPSQQLCITEWGLTWRGIIDMTPTAEQDSSPLRGHMPRQRRESPLLSPQHKCISFHLSTTAIFFKFYIDPKAISLLLQYVLQPCRNSTRSLNSTRPPSHFSQNQLFLNTFLRVNIVSVPILYCLKMILFTASSKWC